MLDEYVKKNVKSYMSSIHEMDLQNFYLSENIKNTFSDKVFVQVTDYSVRGCAEERSIVVDIISEQKGSVELWLPRFLDFIKDKKEKITFDLLKENCLNGNVLYRYIKE